MRFKIALVVFLIGLCLALMEGLEWLNEGHFLSSKEAGEIAIGGWVFATIALLLADAEEGEEKIEKLNKRVSDMEDKLKKRGL
jgi:hypothetical protein